MSNQPALWTSCICVCECMYEYVWKEKGKQF
jgi:hypothetical protein